MSVVCPNPGFSGGLESRYHPNDLLPKSVAGSRAARPPQQWRRSALSVLNPRRREEDAAESCADGRRSDAVAERNLRHASSLVKPGGILKSRASIAHRDNSTRHPTRRWVPRNERKKPRSSGAGAGYTCGPTKVQPRNATPVGWSREPVFLRPSPSIRRIWTAGQKRSRSL